MLEIRFHKAETVSNISDLRSNRWSWQPSGTQACGSLLTLKPEVVPLMRTMGVESHKQIPMPASGPDWD